MTFCVPYRDDCIPSCYVWQVSTSVSIFDSKRIDVIDCRAKIVEKFRIIVVRACVVLHSSIDCRLVNDTRDLLAHVLDVKFVSGSKQVIYVSVEEDSRILSWKWMSRESITFSRDSDRELISHVRIGFLWKTAVHFSFLRHLLLRPTRCTRWHCCGLLCRQLLIQRRTPINIVGLFMDMWSDINRSVVYLRYTISRLLGWWSKLW